ncbi:MAG: DegQ family serine endoprotease [Proteobacteria bacterium]|nr:DegQ family serine endoprotease [Pseudomonadota bacterium]
MKTKMNKCIKNRYPYSVFISVTIVLILAGIISPDMHGKNTLLAAGKDIDTSSNTITLPSFSSLAKKLTPVTVNISTTKIVKGRKAFRHFETPSGEEDPFRDFFGDDFFRRFFGDMPQRDFKQQSLGSGFIIDKEGYILTNNHVVAGADEIKVKLSSEKVYDAKIVGRDEKTDIALIKVTKTPGDLPYATLGDSDALEVGDWVMAIGNPFGLQETVTVGVVSAKWRKIGAGPYDDFIQTDASINPGNSGGPLFNVQGEVVGINTAIYTPSGGNVGIGFATPINLAKKIISPLKEKGKVTRGWLGVIVQDITPELAKSFGTKEGKGALVADVEKDGPADKAGLKRGDVIVDFNGKEVSKMADLPLMVAETGVGKTVTVGAIRDGSKKSYTVKIGELKEKESTPAAREEESNIGLAVEEITPDMARRYSLPEEEGVIITQVEPGSPADDAGFKRGDIIKEINRQPIKTMSQYSKALEKKKSGESILFLVKRGRNSLWIVVKP